MEANQFKLDFVTDLNGALTLKPIRNVFVQDENKAHVFTIKTVRGGAENKLPSSVTIKGYFLPASIGNIAVEIDGAVNKDGDAEITLTRDCYAYTGRFYFIVNAISNAAETCILYVEGAIVRRRTDKVIVPSGAVPTITALDEKVTALNNTIAGFSYESLGAAPAGCGYGDKMAYLDATSGSFEQMLNNVFSGMTNQSARQVQIYDPVGMPEYNNKFIATLWRYTANYAVLDAVTYTGVHAVKCMRGGVWYPWEYNDFSALAARVAALEAALVSATSELDGGEG